MQVKKDNWTGLIEATTIQYAMPFEQSVAMAKRSTRSWLLIRVACCCCVEFRGMKRLVSCWKQLSYTEYMKTI